MDRVFLEPGCPGPGCGGNNDAGFPCLCYQSGFPATAWRRGDAIIAVAADVFAAATLVECFGDFVVIRRAVDLLTGCHLIAAARRRGDRDPVFALAADVFTATVLVSGVGD